MIDLKLFEKYSYFKFPLRVREKGEHGIFIQKKVKKICFF